MAAPPPTIRPPLPAAVWTLGVVSLLMDISSEMIHSLLPLFLVGSLGASVLTVGIIEGIAEATALIVKVFSGVWSDAIGRRKPLAVLGYALGALTKPAFALAGSVGVVVAARFADRVGKGIRGAPRDALLADLTPRGSRGAAFGLRQALDTVGAFVGPLTATALLLWWTSDFRTVFWIAAMPAALSVLLLAVGVREAPRANDLAASAPIDRRAIARLGTAYWSVVAIGAVFALARFSEAFLVLRAQQLGVAPAWVPMVMVAMNVVYAATAYPFGRLADTASRRRLLALGLVVLIAADVVLALAGDWRWLVAGVVLWGVHMGVTQGLLAAMVADSAPANLRGTAYGFFNLASGVALLASSTIAGWLWDRVGSTATFGAGAGFAALTLIALIARRRR